MTFNPQFKFTPHVLLSFKTIKVDFSRRQVCCETCKYYYAGGWVCCGGADRGLESAGADGGSGEVQSAAGAADRDR